MIHIRRIIQTLILCCCIALNVRGQLVNGSFENYSNLPNNLGEWQVVDGWNNCSSMLASPDYYNYLANPSCDIPQTSMAMVNSAEGEGIMGLIACGRKFTNIREYVCNELSSPLVVGKQYNVEFKICNGLRTSVSHSGLAVSDLGVYFSMAQPIQTDYNPMIITPQFKIDTVFYSEDWQTVSFAFIATQPYQFMTFGLFGSDLDKTVHIKEGVDPAYAYYFLDGFKLQKVSDNYNPQNPLPDRGDQSSNGPVNPKPSLYPTNVEQAFFIPNSFTPNNDGFNEEFKPVKGLIAEWQFEIYSPWGEKVFSTDDEELGWNGTYNGAPCNVGTYVWQINYKVQNELKEWRVVVEKGVFTLIR